MKKNLSIILTFIIVLSMSTIAFSSETEINNVSIPAIEDRLTSFTGEIFFYNAETGEILTESGEPFEFETVQFEMPISNEGSEENITPASSFFEFYIVRGGLKKSSGGVFTWWFNVDCPTSPFKKPNIKLTAQLKGNFTNGVGFSNVGSAAYHIYKTNSDYSIDYTWTTTAKTGYYYFHYTLTDYNLAQTKTRTTSSQLWNRTGHVWNFSFRPTGKSLPKPPVNYKKGATSTRPSNLANTYYTMYKNNTGITLDRSLYDVHHIRPLAYGGNNNYSNLIHLPKALHKSVTGWWAGY